MSNSKLRLYFTLSSILLLLMVLVTILSLNNDISRNSGPFKIRITSGGFIPNELYIPINSKVNFLNESQNLTWVASDDHPVHQIYPEFDSKKTIDFKEMWGFTFERAGIIGFHDHLNPQLKGRIIVSSGEGTNSNKSDVSKKKSVATEQIKGIVEEKGPVEAWGFYKNSYKYSDFYGTHDIAHFLGSKIYESLGLNGIGYCDSSFAFGCYHGFVEGFIDSEGTFSLKNLVDKCSENPLDKGEVYCYHGIGHAILPKLKYDLLNSLRFCDSVLSEDFSNLCWDGVFMENASSILSGTYLKKDTHWPCTGVDQKYRETCYQYQPQFFKEKVGFDAFKISEECSNAELVKYREICIKGLAYMITQNYIDDPSAILQKCSTILKEQNKNFCIIYSAEEFVFQGGLNQVAKNMFCNFESIYWNEKCLNGINKRKL